MLAYFDEKIPEHYDSFIFVRIILSVVTIALLHHIDDARSHRTVTSATITRCDARDGISARLAGLTRHNSVLSVDMHTARALAATAAIIITVTVGFSFVYRVYSETVPWLERVRDQQLPACAPVAELLLMLVSTRVQAGVVASLFVFTLLGVVWFLDRCGVWLLHEGVVATVTTVVLAGSAMAFAVVHAVLVSRMSDAAVGAEDIAACSPGDAPTAGVAGRVGVGILICLYTMSTVLFSTTLPLVGRWLTQTPRATKYRRVHISTDAAHVIEHTASKVDDADDDGGDDTVFSARVD
jgi:hypothetical protein